MTNIWSFLLQSLTVSLVAALLLLLKNLLGDKLSPRWQYGIWSILALRIVLPAGLAGRYFVLPLPLWLETVKAIAERTLDSAYTAAYIPSLPRFTVPWITGNPVSVTDWLFVVYFAGTVVSLVWYVFSYIRLRLLLHRGRPVSEIVQKQIEYVCMRYNLKACPAVMVEGLPSAFICGVIRPVLAVPADGDIDDKVLLHELLHLKHQDALQSALWTLLHALHWCNPFMQYIFNRIGNDMEALCDQRVLERLGGEARRDYGAILLQMTSEKYPRAPGTTSLSNGGKNIARRIAAITRFKKYPRGMALVSVCIAIVLLQPAIIGAKASGYTPAVGHSVRSWTFELAMASARTTRCSTLAGALDTYAKGVMLDNGLYIAMASPLSEQEYLAEAMRTDTLDDHRQDFYLLGQLGGSWANSPDAYKVYNLEEQADGSYTALLVFQMDSLVVDTQGDRITKESGIYPDGVAWLPVRAGREDGWVVTKAGGMERAPYTGSITAASLWKLLPPQAAYSASGESGSVTAEAYTAYSVDNRPASTQNTVFMGTAGPPFDTSLKPDAKFTGRSETLNPVYTFGGTDAERRGLTGAGFQMIPIDNLNKILEFPSPKGGFYGGQSAVGSDYSMVNEFVDEDWDNTATIGFGNTTYDTNGVEFSSLPPGYGVEIYWNGELRETLILKAVTGNE